MNLADTYRLLRQIAAVDNRRVDDATVAMWQAILAGDDYPDCSLAVVEHFRNRTDYLVPAHVHAGAAAKRQQRHDDQVRRDSQARQAEADQRSLPAAPSEPVRVGDLLADLRRKLPSGDPAKLRHRRILQTVGPPTVIGLAPDPEGETA